MTNRTRTGIVLLVLAQGLAGCGGGASSAPSAPSVVPQLVVFTDPASGFSTSDVRDVREQIVRFNFIDRTAGELIWTADGTRFPGYRVNGNFIRADASLEVVFGTKDGDRRAYLAFNYYPTPRTIVDIKVVGGQLVITETNVPVPGT